MAEIPRKTATLNRIHAEALRLFVAQGIDGTSIADIARAAGVAQGALYRHYAGKDELVFSLFRDHYIAMAEKLEALQRASAGIRAKLAAMIAEFVRFHDADPTLFRFLLVVQHAQLARLQPDSRSPVNVLRNVIAAAIRSGELPKQDAELATAFVLGVLLQPATFASYGRLPPKLAPHRELLAAAAWRALQPR